MKITSGCAIVQIQEEVLGYWRHSGVYTGSAEDGAVQEWIEGDGHDEFVREVRDRVATMAHGASSAAASNRRFFNLQILACIVKMFRLPIIDMYETP